jgi:type I restriction enzyme S subunit
VGARRERTRPEAFLEIEIPIPSIQKQRYGLEVFRKLEHLANLQDETATELDALMPSILSKAFRGDL